MNLLNKLERKLGRYAIPNLSLYLILCYGCGYLISLINSSFLNYLTLNPYLILHGQVWRLFTWILIPPTRLDFLDDYYVVFLLFYWYKLRTNVGCFLLQCILVYGDVFYGIG